MKFTHRTKPLLSIALISMISAMSASLLAHQTIATTNTERNLKAADYKIKKIHGWNVHIQKTANDHPKIKPALEELESQLKTITELINPTILAKLQLVPVWLNNDEKGPACYHPDAGWLAKNNRMPEKARSVELQSVNGFINSSKNQPMIMLHEMAHAFHHRVHDFKHPVITRAFDKAVTSKSYEKVKHINGRFVKHYALSNEKEYFAEATEAYFGKNDYYPFNREELKKHDSAAYAMLESLWEVNTKNTEK